MFGGSFPIALQHDSRQCGVACLKILCEYYGVKYSLYDISHYCHASKRGVSMLGISEGAESLGLDYLAIRCSLNAFTKAFKSPVIVHWKHNHFVVLYRISKNGQYFFVSDPGKGLMKYSREEFENFWWSSVDDDGNREGIVMLLSPGERFGKIQSCGGDSYDLHYVLSFFRKYKNKFLFIVSLLALVTALEAIAPCLTQAIVDYGIKNNNVDFICVILVGQLLIAISRTFFDFLRRKISVNTSMHINVSLVSAFLRKLVKLPMHFFEVKHY